MTVTAPIANVDFQTYQGDDVRPTFTVVNAAGLPLNISSVSEIVWTVVRNEGAPAILTKTRSAGQISFVTDGSDGRFYAQVTKTDTAALSGFYLHRARITDAIGNVSTVTVGRMQVGLPPSWSYDPTQLAAQPLYQVRLAIGDTVEADPQMQDAEILYFLTRRPSLFGAAAECCRSLAAKFFRSADMAAGDTKISYSQMAKGYLKQAQEFEQRAAMTGAAGAAAFYAGGVSIADMQQQEANTDRVPPSFQIGMDENFLPVPSIGGETMDSFPNMPQSQS